MSSMKTAAATQASDPDSTSLRTAGAAGAAPLNECVRSALECYLENIANHDVVDLYSLVMEEVERPLFEIVLNHTHGNLSQASRLLGLTRNTLRKRLSDYGIER